MYSPARTLEIYPSYFNRLIATGHKLMKAYDQQYIFRRQTLLESLKYTTVSKHSEIRFQNKPENIKKKLQPSLYK